MSGTPSASGEASSVRSTSPLVPLSEFEENVLNPSSQQSDQLINPSSHQSEVLNPPSQQSESGQGSEYGALHYPASESGQTAISTSTMVTQRGTKKKRADLLMTPQQPKMLAIDAREDALRTNLSPDATGHQLESEQTDTRIYIWGTRVCVAELQSEFRKFLTTFCTDQLEDDENAMQVEDGRVDEMDPNVPVYMDKLRGINASEIPILNLNLGHVRQYSEQLYKIIVAYPDESIGYLDATVDELFEMTYKKKLQSTIEIRPYNAEQTKNMRDLNPQDVGQLITTYGMVTRISPIIPEMKTGYFQCAICNSTIQSEVDCGRIEEPVNCKNCHNTYSFQLVHNRSLFIDKQVIKLQEIPGDMPAGQTQHTITLFVHGSLVESVHPGDRVSVTGIYRATPVRLNPVQRAVHAIYRTSIDVIHFRKLSQGRLHEVADGLFLSEERIERVLALSRYEDVVDRLTRAIAPNIFGHEEIKRGLLCLLFGGTRKSGIADEEVEGEGADAEGDGEERRQKLKLRSEVNILLCGDPGTAKSQLLQYIFQLVPRSQFTSGKGSSAVGLSASITRDPDSKSVVLQTGALVLADNGVCCIDEFDKMNDSTRSILHEVMEQQTLSIAKAGIICQLNARTSILAAANPIDSKWNKRKNIVENVHLPPTLLSRFDLIFLVLDPQDEEYDRRLSKHLVNFYLEVDKEAERQQRVDMAFLRDYIGYAKAHIRPKLGEEASQLLIQKYQFMRSLGKQVKQISAYPRQLESLIRLSEAFAKMRLSNRVEPADVEMAYELQREALRQSAVNPDTGCVEVNIIATGYSEKHKRLVGHAADQIRQEVEHRRGAFSLAKLYRDMRTLNKMLDRESFDDAVKQLVLEGFLLRTGDKARLIAAPEQADKGAD